MAVVFIFHLSSVKMLMFYNLNDLTDYMVNDFSGMMEMCVVGFF